MQHFRMYFDQNIFEKTLCQTNLYSTQKTENNINATVSEIKRFFDVHALRGLMRMPSCRMLWNKTINYLLVSSVMSRNRFDKLKNSFHINKSDSVTL